MNPSKRLVLAAFLSSIAVTYFVDAHFEEMNYFVRSRLGDRAHVCHGGHSHGSSRMDGEYR